MMHDEKFSVQALILQTVLIIPGLFFEHHVAQYFNPDRISCTNIKLDVLPI